MKLQLALILSLITLTAMAQSDIQSDLLQTSKGELEMHFIGHGTLMFTMEDLVIHIDPVSREGDYDKLPKADLILVTHQHGDHLDASAIDKILKEGTVLVMTETCYENHEEDWENVEVMKNGDKAELKGVRVEALPAYNIKHERSSGKPFHPKGEGNAYLLKIGDKHILIGGDTENIPELKVLKDIDVAFLPMNLPYTMTPDMVADLALAMKPKILYPYHFGKTDTGELVKLLKDHPEIEVRIRDLE